MDTQTEAVKQKNFVIKVLAIVSTIVLIVLALQQARRFTGVLFIAYIIAIFILAVLFYYASMQLFYQQY